MNQHRAPPQQTRCIRIILAVGAACQRLAKRQSRYQHGSVLLITCFMLCPLTAISGAQHSQQRRDKLAMPSIQASGYTPSGMRAIPDPLYGVTVDDVTNLSGIVESLSHLSHKPTTRIVFDEGQPPSAYTEAIKQIQPVSYILGMFADSTALRRYTPAEYSQRVLDYLNAFGTKVDIWEIGNEINGEWLGDDAATKMVNAYDLVKQAGKRTALTLYYNGLDDSNNCYQNRDALMFRWAQAHIPDRLKHGLDYVFISYYEQDCPGVSKDWTAVFTQLHQMFPHSRIGFGENGTTHASDPSWLKVQYMNEYYPLWVHVPHYVAGHFWWYFAEDGVPSTDNQLWTRLNDSMNALETA